jgi:hypothetical protein
LSIIDIIYNAGETMNDFSNVDMMNLHDLGDSVLKSFGDRYANEATRLLHTGVILPTDSDMIQLALAITIGLYMRKLIDNDFDEKEVIH